MTEYCIILTTADSSILADNITELLLEQGLAACAQHIPIKSFYTWKNKIEKSSEILMQIKTQTVHYKEIEDLIKKNHSYETPEIICIPILCGSSDYLDWVKKETTKTT